MKMMLTVVTACCVLGGLGLVSSLWAQAAPAAQSSPPPQANRYFTQPPNAAFSTDYHGGFFRAQNPYGAAHEGSARSEVARLANQLRDADESKKAELMKELESSIDKYFDEDMEAREKEITKLEDRLKKLRAQMERRRKAKAEIIQLQLKVLVNEAEGLGFSGGPFLDGGLWTPFSAGGGYPVSTPALPGSDTPRTKTAVKK